MFVDLKRWCRKVSKPLRERGGIKELNELSENWDNE